MALEVGVWRGEGVEVGLGGHCLVIRHLKRVPELLQATATPAVRVVQGNPASEDPAGEASPSEPSLRTGRLALLAVGPALL